MKTKITLLLLLLITSITGAIANENVSISDNTSASGNTVISSTVLDIGTEEEEKDPPGFEAVFAIVGLLAIVYLILRQKN